jgi:hypothetical protein
MGVYPSFIAQPANANAAMTISKPKDRLRNRTVMFKPLRGVKVMSANQRSGIKVGFLPRHSLLIGLITAQNMLKFELIADISCSLPIVLIPENR